MGKAKQKKKSSQLKRRQMVEDVFKKGKKQREIAKKFDEKIAMKQGTSKNKEKFQQMKQQKKKETNRGREQIAELNKKLDAIRTNRKPSGQSIL